MEYGKKDWQRSEGRYRSLGRENLNKDKPLSAYRPADRENTKERRPNEMMTMESSYGGIALGANRRHKMTMVVHEKRSSKGQTLKNDNQRIEGSHTAAISQLRGNFYTNSHSRKDSALAYEEDMHESPLRMMERLQEMMDENYQSSGQQVMPFLNRKEDRAMQKEIQEQLRESREKGDRTASILWGRRQEAFRQEQAEKAEMRRRFYREIMFSQEKSKKLMHQDAPFLLGVLEEISREVGEDNTEDESENEKN